MVFVSFLIALLVGSFGLCKSFNYFPYNVRYRNLVAHKMSIFDKIFPQNDYTTPRPPQTFNDVILWIPFVQGSTSTSKSVTLYTYFTFLFLSMKDVQLGGGTWRIQPSDINKLIDPNEPEASFRLMFMENVPEKGTLGTGDIEIVIYRGKVDEKFIPIDHPGLLARRFRPSKTSNCKKSELELIVFLTDQLQDIANDGSIFIENRLFEVVGGNLGFDIAKKKYFYSRR